MASMFPSFSSILPAELKSRLGIGPKPVKKPDDQPQEDHENFENVGNNSSIYNGSGYSFAKTSLNQSRLPTALQADVRSPGFTSRLSSLVRDTEDDCNSVRYSRVGSLPTVNLKRRQQPRLNVRKLRNGSSPVTIKIAPAEPFSPFKSRYGPVSSVSRRSRGSGELQEKSTDPRSVIAVLAELSGKRSRRPSDDPSDVSEEESKRARRDSSSSLGSSLSMEMPPLFSNGVVGQTTSHLVSRETDLSLGSLLSRNQTLFGGSGPHSLAGALNNHAPAVAHATSQTNHGPNRSRCVSSEILASLSSSRCMLRKRGRDLSEDEDEDDFDTPKPKRPNVYRSPDAHMKRAKNSSQSQSSRKSSSATSEDNTLEAEEDENKATSKSSTPCRDVVVLPSPSELLGSPSRSASKTPPKECQSHAISSQKDIDADRKLQRKRLNKMLAVFSPEDHVDEDVNPEKLTEKIEKPIISMSVPPVTISTTTDQVQEKEGASVDSQGASDDKTAQSDKQKQPAGGFSFTFGSSSAGPAPPNTPTATTSGGFPFDLNAANPRKESEPSATKALQTSSGGLSVNFGAITSSNVEISTITSSTKTTASMLSEGSIPSTTVTASSSLPSTVDSGQRAAVAFVGMPGPGSLPPPYTDSKLEKTLSTASTTKPPSFGEVSKSSTESSAASFSLGDTLGASAATSSFPTLTFGVTSAPRTTTTDSLFKFGDTNKKTGATASVAPTFSLGSTTTSATAAESSKPTDKVPPIFSFGQTTAAKVVKDSSNQDSPFQFGATKCSGLSVGSGTGAAPTLNLGATTTAPLPSTTALPVFSFGQTSTTTSATSFGSNGPQQSVASGGSGPQQSVFSFGCLPPASTASSASTAPSTKDPAPAFQFGQASAAPSFNFGATAPSTTAAPVSTASFGGFGTNAPTTTAQPAPSSGFGGFENSGEVKPTFSFGAAPVTSSNPFGGFQAPVTTSVSASSFGATPVTKTGSSSGLFNFGAKPATDSPAAPFTFGGKSAAPASVAAPAPTFSFGGDKAAAATTKPFSFGSSTASTAPPAAAAPAAVFQFGQTAPVTAREPQQPKQNTGFNFGAAAQSPPANVFNFNAASSNPPPASNPFSSTVPPSNPSNPFSASTVVPAPAANPFGAPPQNTTSPFGGFGASPPATGGFGNQGTAAGGFGGFGAAAPATGGGGGFGAAAPAAGGGFGAAAAPGGGGMFSIGAGTNTPSRTSTTRRYATARRRDRK